MTLLQLEYFMNVAHTLHFMHSAENLYVSQSSLSYAINTLEEELGVPLFVRKKGRRVVLSTYGKEFLPYVENILQYVHKGKMHMKYMQNPGGGIVRVSFGYINGASVIAKMFKEFYKENTDKEIEIKLQINNSVKKIEKDVLSGDIDLTFTSSSNVSGLDQKVFMEQKLVVMLPRLHPLSGRKRLTIEDIKDEPLIGYSQGWNLSNWINEIFSSCGYYPNVIEYQLDWTAEITYIMMGRGIGILPRIPVDENEITVIPLEHPLNKRNIYLCWSKEITGVASYVRDFCIRYSEKNLKK